MSVRWARIETKELIELWSGLGSLLFEGLADDPGLVARLEVEIAAALKERGVDPYELAMGPK